MLLRRARLGPSASACGVGASASTAATSSGVAPSRRSTSASRSLITASCWPRVAWPRLISSRLASVCSFTNTEATVAVSTPMRPMPTSMRTTATVRPPPLTGNRSP